MPRPGRPRTNSKQRRAIAPPPRKSTDDKIPPPKIKVPDFSEWHDYLGNFAIKWVTRAYIAFVFRGIDRYEILSKVDNEALELDEQQLSDIAKPLAHIASRSNMGKKYGRVIIDSSDGVAAFIQLAMWANRVNRIAKKYRPERGKHDHGKRVVPGEVISDGPGGESVQEPSQQNSFTSNPGFVPSGHGYN